MRRSPESPNPWGLLCTFPGWRGLWETLQDLEQLLRTIGGDAADLGATVAAVLEDPVSARADLPATYRLRLGLQKARPPEQLDLESEVPGWVSEVARAACDVPVLLEAVAAADGLGPTLTAELPRALQGRFTDLVQRLRQMLQGRKLKAPLDAPHPSPTAVGASGLSYVVPQPDGYALVLPQEATPALYLAAWRELAWALLAYEGADVARLHLALLAHWPAELCRDQVYTALGLRKPGPERCYAAMRRLQGLRLSLYLWSVEGGVIELEHQAQEIWTLRLREGGQAHLVEEGGALVARGQEWWVAPGPHSFAATLPPGTVDAGQAQLLLGDLEGSRNRLSLALGLTLGRGQSSLTNRELLTLAGYDPTEEAPDLWPKVRAAIRLQQKQAWIGDLSRWGKRSEMDWQGFLETESRFTTAADALAP